jgi:hypothetical protein
VRLRILVRLDITPSPLVASDAISGIGILPMGFVSFRGYKPMKLLAGIARELRVGKVSALEGKMVGTNLLGG